MQFSERFGVEGILVLYHEVNWHQVRRMVVFVGTLMAVAALLSYLFSVLVVPLFISFFLSYLLEPIVELLERRKVPRFFGILGLVVGAFAVLIIAAVAIAPEIYSQVIQLLGLVPGVSQALYERWYPVVKELVLKSNLVNEDGWDLAFSEFNVLSQVTAPLRQAVAGLWRGTPLLVQGVVDAVLIPVVTFFLLLDWPTIRKLLVRLTPLDLRRPSGILLARVDETLRALIKGQVLVAMVLAVLYSVGLSALGISSGLAIGLVAGACRLIPYMDVVVGGGLSAIVLMSQFQGMGQVIGVVIVFMAVQVIDATVVTPRIIGNRVGLHPLLVVISVIAFGHLLGFYGVLLAIPLAAILKVAMELSAPFYEASAAFDPSHRRGRRSTDHAAPIVEGSLENQNKV